MSALGRALAVERRARYIDFRGKRTTFSKFMRGTADKLCKRFPGDARWSTIRGLFQMYANLDVAARISIVRRTEELLFPDSVDKSVVADEPITSPAAVVNKRVGATEPPSLGEPVVAPAAFAAAASSAAASSAALPTPTVALSSTSSAAPAAPASSGSLASRAITSSSPAKKEPVLVNPKPARPVSDPFGTEIKFVKGVGPKLAEVFNRINIFTAGDLIRHYPRHHLDFQNRLLIRELQPGQEVTVFGTIRSVGAFQAKRGNMSIMTIVIGDGTGSVVVSRFIGGKSNKYLLDRYKAQYPKGAQVLASGW